MPQPRVFIGSSSEGHHIAELLQLGLDSHAECTIWSQGVFGLSGVTLQSLCESAESFDFAILVLTPDDLVQKRKDLRRAPRDNVLFELGLFMGALGRDSTFIVCCSDDGIELPSDLAGATTVQWRRRSDGNMRAALGPACTAIRLAIEARGAKVTGSSSGLDEVRALVERQSRDIRMLVETIQGATRQAPASSSGLTTKRLSFFVGTWRDLESGTVAYPRFVDGELVCPYYWGGSSRLSGEYYDVVRVGDAIIAKFRWLHDMAAACGGVYLRIESENELVGGWWFDPAVDDDALLSPQDPEVSTLDRRMISLRLVRDRHGVVPKWVLDHYEAARKPGRGTT